jgi:Family of unknown function (DUF6502)
MKLKRSLAKQSTSNAKQSEVKSLLTPVVGILRAAGLDLGDVRVALEAVWNRPMSAGQNLRIDNLEDPHSCALIVSTWIRNLSYVNDEGAPRTLRMSGKYGFGALVKAAAPNVSPAAALRTLVRYGNVTTERDGRIRLQKSFLKICTESRIAYEPSARFLEDAADSVRASLGMKSGLPGSARNFWRVAESVRLPAKKIPLYLSYANRRSLAFLQEMDDWLEANSPSDQGSGRQKLRKVGLGIFGICSPVKTETRNS